MGPHQNQRVSCNPILSDSSILVQLDRNSTALNKRRPCARNPSTHPALPCFPGLHQQNIGILSLIWRAAVVPYHANWSNIANFVDLTMDVIWSTAVSNNTGSCNIKTRYLPIACVTVAPRCAGPS
jgi:hypothetical protein